MVACKRQREHEPAIEWTLPTELLLEIVARSDTRALVRSAAACKLLRHDILSPHFISRVTQKGGIVPPCILTYVNTHYVKADPSPPISLVFPNTPVAMSFLDGHLSPYMSRSVDDLLIEHCPVSSRGGLVLFRRRHFSNSLSNLCVYDPMTGHRTFLSYPPGINQEDTVYVDKCILLTSADGIHCTFMLFFPRIVNRCFTRTIKVHIATSTCGTWTPAAAMSDNISDMLLQRWFAIRRYAVVLHSGVIHWLMPRHGLIVTYNVYTMEYGTINLPGPITDFKGQLDMGSHDGRKLLYILGSNGFNISVWHQFPSGDWPLEAVTINTEEKLRSLYPNISPNGPLLTVFQCGGEGRSVVFLYIYCYRPRTSCHAVLFDLDLETVEMLVEQDKILWRIPLEVDLLSRLQAMKIFT